MLEEKNKNKSDELIKNWTYLIQSEVTLFNKIVSLRKSKVNS